jgi:hypothetical protein
MDRFSAAIYPYTTTAGKLANLSNDPSRPELLMEKGLWVLRGWIQNAVYSLDPSNMNQVLELFLFASGNAFPTSRFYLLIFYQAIDRSRARRYINQADFRRKVLSTACRFDVRSGRRTPLYLDLQNCLFWNSMESGVTFLQ